MRRTCSKNKPASVDDLTYAELFGGLFGSSHSLIAYLNGDFDFILVNRAFAKALDRTPKFFLGKSYFDLFPDRQSEEAFRGVMETGRGLRGLKKPLVLPNDAKSMSPCWDWSVEPLRSGGKPAGLVLTLREVELERQLRQTQRMEALGTLAGGIAHDLNNILMPIIMNAEMIVEDAEESTSIHHFATKVLASAHHGRDLVRRILAFSRKKDVEKKRFVIAKPVEEALELFRPTLLSNATLSCRIAEDVGRVKGDPAEIQEMVVNLCSNAAHAVGTKKGTIEVCLENVTLSKKRAAIHAALRPGPYVRLSVKDTGVGMDESLAERIFDPFFTTKKPGEGTGMGLAMVHSAVRRHGGAILVRSAPNRGAVFEVYLPRVMRVEREVESVPPLPRGNMEKILLVDDERDIIETARNVLLRLGYDVSAQSDATAALRLFERDPGSFDLVILDFALSDMTGLELARKLRSVREDVPILLATGFGGAVDPDGLGAAGIEEILYKPLTSREVGEVIYRVLNTGERRQKTQKEGRQCGKDSRYR